MFFQLAIIIETPIWHCGGKGVGQARRAVWPGCKIPQFGLARRKFILFTKISQNRVIRIPFDAEFDFLSD